MSEHGYSLKQAAVAVGLSKATVAKLLDGSRREVTLEVLERVRGALGVHWDYFFEPHLGAKTYKNYLLSEMRPTDPDSATRTVVGLKVEKR